MTRDLVIVGLGGVGRALRTFVNDVDRQGKRWRFLGFVDDAGESRRQSGFLGPIDWLSGKDLDVLVGLGLPATRRRVVERLQRDAGLRFPALVHPRAYVPDTVPVGRGTIVYPGACIDPDTALGDFVLMNQNATLGHDSVLLDYATLAPGVSIGGTVTVGSGANVGIGASCIQGLTLGAWCTIGASAAVIRDVVDGDTVVGVPATSILGSRTS